MIRMIVAGTHRPMSSAFGVPAQRQLLQGVPTGPVQIRAGVISGAHHEIDLLFLAGRLAADWRAAHEVTPVLLETLIDPARFDGASYQAANWIVVGTTSGRGRNDRALCERRARAQARVDPETQKKVADLRERLENLENEVRAKSKEP